MKESRQISVEVDQLGSEYWLKAERSMSHLRDLVGRLPFEHRRWLYGSMAEVEGNFHSMKAILEQQELQMEFLLKQHEKMSQRYVDQMVEERMRSFYVRPQQEAELAGTAQEG